MISYSVSEGSHSDFVSSFFMVIYVIEMISYSVAEGSHSDFISSILWWSKL